MGLKLPNDWWCVLMGTYVLAPDENGIIRYDNYDSEQEAQKIFNEVVSPIEEIASKTRALEAGEVGELGESITRWGQSMQDFGQDWTKNVTIPLLLIIGIIILGAVCVGAVS